MKKQKVVILDNEQQNKHDLDAIHKLQEGLSKVDQFPVYTPDLQWFEKMVQTEKQNSRKKLHERIIYVYHNRINHFKWNNRIFLPNACRIYFNSNYYFGFYCTIYNYKV